MVVVVVGRGGGITLSLPRSQQDNKRFLSTDTLLPSRRKRQHKKTGPSCLGTDVFLGAVCQSGLLSFTLKL